jgi:hypothetical protein
MIELTEQQKGSLKETLKKLDDILEELDHKDTVFDALIFYAEGMRAIIRKLIL